MQVHIHLLKDGRDMMCRSGHGTWGLPWAAPTGSPCLVRLPPNHVTSILPQGSCTIRTCCRRRPGTLTSSTSFG